MSDERIVVIRDFSETSREGGGVEKAEEKRGKKEEERKRGREWTKKSKAKNE